jgi:uncharacterized protein (TIGR02757 family)
LNKKEIKLFLDEKVELYNRPDFIVDDPILIPHKFSRKEDIEIAGFLSSTIAWGQRKTILANAIRMMEFMEWQPYLFLKENEHNDFFYDGFVHRTFNSTDFEFFLRALKNLYANYGGLEKAFSMGKNNFERIANFQQLFFNLDGVSVPDKSRKHVSNPNKNSACKRLNMYLRWMVRDDKKGVDFGIWNNIPMADLMLPLDVHTGNTSRKLGILKRKQNDWKTVEEITSQLRKFDVVDPCKYDFALFGLGVVEKF